MDCTSVCWLFAGSCFREFCIGSTGWATGDVVIFGSSMCLDFGTAFIPLMPEPNACLGLAGCWPAERDDARPGISAPGVALPSQAQGRDSTQVCSRNPAQIPAYPADHSP